MDRIELVSILRLAKSISGLIWAVLCIKNGNDEAMRQNVAKEEKHPKIKISSWTFCFCFVWNKSRHLRVKSGTIRRLRSDRLETWEPQTHKMGVNQVNVVIMPFNDTSALSVYPHNHTYMHTHTHTKSCTHAHTATHSHTHAPKPAITHAHSHTLGPIK